MESYRNNGIPQGGPPAVARNMRLPSGQAAPQQAPTGNLWQDVFWSALDPKDAAAIQFYASATGQRINYDIPLRAQIITDRNGVEVTQDAPAFDLRYRFPFFGYIIRATATVRALELEIPVADSFIGVVSPLDYIEARCVRLNSEALTTSGTAGSDFVPLSQWFGTGGLPYRFDLIQFVAQSEEVILNCRITPEVDTLPAGGAVCSFHVLRLPVAAMGG